MLTIPIIEDQDRESLLCPYVAPHGWAVATHVERTLAIRFVEHLGIAADDEIEQVNVALRAAQDL